MRATGFNRMKRSQRREPQDICEKVQRLSMGRPFVELSMFKIMPVSSTAAPNPPPPPQPQGGQKHTQSPLPEKLGDLDTVPAL